MHHLTIIGNRSFSHEPEKKEKYLQTFLDQRSHFNPFAASCDRVLGNEANVLYYYKTPCRKPHRNFKLYGVNVCIAIVRATHLCSRLSRSPTSRMNHHLQWEGGGRPQPVLPLDEQQTYLKIDYY